MSETSSASRASGPAPDPEAERLFKLLLGKVEAAEAAAVGEQDAETLGLLSRTKQWLSWMRAAARTLRQAATAVYDACAGTREGGASGLLDLEPAEAVARIERTLAEFAGWMEDQLPAKDRRRTDRVFAIDWSGGGSGGDADGRARWEGAPVDQSADQPATPLVPLLAEIGQVYGRLPAAAATIVAAAVGKALRNRTFSTPQIRLLPESTADRTLLALVPRGREAVVQKGEAPAASPGTLTIRMAAPTGQPTRVTFRGPRVTAQSLCGPIWRGKQGVAGGVAAGLVLNEEFGGALAEPPSFAGIKEAKEFLVLDPSATTFGIEPVIKILDEDAASQLKVEIVQERSTDVVVYPPSGGSGPGQVYGFGAGGSGTGGNVIGGQKGSGAAAPGGEGGNVT